MSPEVKANIKALVADGRFADAMGEVDRLLAASPGDPNLQQLKILLVQMQADAGMTQRAAGSSVALTSALPATRPTVAAMSGADRLEAVTIESIVKDLSAEKDPSKARSLAKDLLNRSEALAEKHPDVQSLWLDQAMAAIVLDDVKIGNLAGKKLIAAGAMDSTQPGIMAVMISLNRRGWLNENLPGQLQISTSPPPKKSKDFYENLIEDDPK